MRSNNLVRHMKVHQPRVQTNEEMCRDLVLEIAKNVVEKCNPTKDQNELKRKLEEPVASKFSNRDFSINLKFDSEALEKAALEKHEMYLQKIELGKELYKILGKGVVTEESFPCDWKDALDLYRKQGNEIDCENVILKPWQTELLQWIKSPSDRRVIWIVGAACGEGKTFFQKYVRSMFGRRRVVAGGINIKSSSANICHALSKRPLSTTDIFLFNIGKSKKKFEEVNYEVLEDLKDGDAFASKYNSQELKIKVPNVVMVFSNNEPNTQELATDRWKVFQIVNGQLEEIEVDQDRSTNLAKKNTNSKKKSIYRYNSDSDSDVC